MSRSLLAVALAAMTGCTAAAAGGVIVGGAGTIGAVSMYKRDCHDTGCTYGNVLALCVGAIAVPLMIVSGVFLIRGQTESDSAQPRTATMNFR